MSSYANSLENQLAFLQAQNKAHANSVDKLAEDLLIMTSQRDELMKRLRELEAGDDQSLDHPQNSS